MGSISTFALRQLAAALGEQAPGFAVAFVAVADLLSRWDYGAQRRCGASSLAQQ